MNKNRIIHKKYIEDVALEVSLSKVWREKLICGRYEEEHLISFGRIEEVPDYVKEKISKYKLEYFVSKVEFCPEKFDDGLVIFKFTATNFPEIVRYSGNNPSVL